MRLLAFRVQHFRSVADSGKCYVSPEVTVLAGKNESGKTNLLAALEFLHADTAFSDDDLPFHCEGPPHLIFWFELTEDDEEQICRSLKAKASLKGLPLVATRAWGVESFVFEGEALRRIQASVGREPLQQELAKGLEEFVKRFRGELEGLSVDLGSFPSLLDGYGSLVEFISSNPGVGSEECREALEQIGATAETVRSLPSDEDIDRTLRQRMPNPVYFDSFSDELPDSIPVQEAVSESSPIVKAFCTVAELDLGQLKNLQSGQTHKRIQLAALSTDKYARRFRDYWAQEDVLLTVTLDGENMAFSVKSASISKPFRPSQRSKGFRWFTSFFLTVAAKTDEFGENVLILIDEPGLYLHAKAQSQVLDLLNRISRESQVVFSTHSPYLLDPTRLDRIRLVIKDDDQGTVVRNNVFHGADEDTMTPVVTAVGLDLARSWGTPKARNLVVEGASDYYYLTSMLEALGSEVLKGVAMIPCVGHTKVTTLVSLLTGWGLRACVLLDEKGTARTRKKLAEFGFPSEALLTVGDKPEDSIEDLFDIADFNRIVGLSGGDSKRPAEDMSNSDWVKKDKLNKLTLARLLAQKMREADGFKLRKSSRDRFEALLKRIAEALPE